jgi:hypothetical protein
MPAMLIGHDDQDIGSVIALGHGGYPFHFDTAVEITQDNFTAETQRTQRTSDRTKVKVETSPLRLS